MTREDRVRIERLASMVLVRSDGETLARLLAERDSMLALLRRFTFMYGDDDITETEWMAFSRDVDLLIARARPAEEG